MPTHNGRVSPLFKLLKCGGLNFRNGKVVDAAEPALNISRALSYGLMPEAEQTEMARNLDVPKKLRHYVTILDQVDNRICRLLSIMSSMKNVIAEHSWPIFWQCVLEALSWANKLDGAPRLDSSDLSVFVEALVEARARAIHNKRAINSTDYPKPAPEARFIPSLSLWLDFLEECHPDRYPDWKIAADDTCDGQPVHDLEVIFPGIAREHNKRRANGDIGQGPETKRQKKKARAKKAKAKKQAALEALDETVKESIVTAMKKFNEEATKEATEETKVDVKEQVTEE